MTSHQEICNQFLLLLDYSTGSSLLKGKYQATTRSKVKWLKNQMKLNSESIPIEFNNDREYVKRNIERYPDTFKYASNDIRSDTQFIMDVIVKKNNFAAIQHIGRELLTDTSFILEMIEGNKNILRYAYANDLQYIYYHYDDMNEDDEEEENLFDCSLFEIKVFDFKLEKEIALKKIEEDALQYDGLDDLLKVDIDVCLTCLKKSVYGIYHVFSSPQNSQNKELFERGVGAISEIIFYFADEMLKQDIEFVSHLIQVNPHVLLFADKKLRQVKNLVLECVKLDYETLNYASGKLLKDEEFMKQAKSIGNFKHNKNYEDVIIDFISKNNRGLQKLPHSLRKRRDLMVKVMSVCEYSCSMGFVDESLVQDKGFILECINSMSSSATYGLDTYLPYEMRKDSEIAISLVYKCPKNFPFFSYLPFVSNNRNLILTVIKGDPTQYQYILEDFKNDKEITREAMKHSSHYLAHSTQQLQMDKEFVLEFILIDPEVIKCTNLQYDPKFILQAVKLNGNVLKYCANFSDEIEIEAVKQNGYYSPTSWIISQLIQFRMDNEYPDLVK